MQLTGPEILRRMNAENPDIIIKPFDERCLGSNSYDLHLGDTLKIYKHTLPWGMKPALEYRGDPKMHRMQDWFEYPVRFEVYRLNPDEYDIRNPRYLIDPTNPAHHETMDIKIPDTGLILSPDIGYLGTTVEYTETRNLFPYIDGKSSIGRNFILNHHTAGRGDDGFCIRRLFTRICVSARFTMKNLSANASHMIRTNPVTITARPAQQRPHRCRWIGSCVI